MTCPAGKTYQLPAKLSVVSKPAAPPRSHACTTALPSDWTNAAGVLAPEGACQRYNSALACARMNSRAVGTVYVHTVLFDEPPAAEAVLMRLMGVGFLSHGESASG